jgi:hypothetical protein
MGSSTMIALASEGADELRSHSSWSDAEDEVAVSDGVEAVGVEAACGVEDAVGVEDGDDSDSTETVDAIENREPTPAATAARCGGNAAEGLSRSNVDTSTGTAVRMISTSVMSSSSTPAAGTAIVRGPGFLRFEGVDASGEATLVAFASAMRSIADWSTSERTSRRVRLA